MKSIQFPISGIDKNINTNILTERSIVVIGANGSGKTRLGNWLEEKNDPKKVIRVSAQKSLEMPESVSPISVEQAKTLLMFGYFDGSFERSTMYKIGARWGNNPVTRLLNDYDKLLTYLFSDNYEVVLNYASLMKKSTERIEPPKTKLDKTVEIWEQIIPHRKLVVSSGAINTKPVNDEKIYKALNMSDGERVIFYLIGECLSAPENGIIIIDEPELHLHKSILRKLWDLIEKERTDCLFIYLTHDLEFASTRTGSTKICIKDFDGEHFFWYQIEENNSIPDDIYLEILGSRNPIIFIEGSSSSYDRELYSLIYPDFTIKALGSCSKVIEATKSFNRLREIHNLQCYGIIDRDYKQEDFLNALRDDLVYSPLVAEVENLFLVEEVLLTVANQYCLSKPVEKVEEIKDWVISQFERYKTNFALESTSSYINYKLNSYDSNSTTIEDLKNNFLKFTATIDIDSYYMSKLAYAEQLIKERNYTEIIKVFNHKGIVAQIGKFFEIRPSSYTRKVKDIIDSGNKAILEAMKRYLPSL